MTSDFTADFASDLAAKDDSVYHGGPKDWFDSVLRPSYDAKEALRGYWQRSMFSVPHLVIIFIVVLVVFGPHKLPELARGLGKMMAEFRKASTDFKMAFEEEMRTIERQARETELRKVQEAAAASSGEQPATLATAAETETPKIFPESIAPIEPTIVPVSESIARASYSHDEPPITEGTAAPSESSTATPATGPTDELTETGKSPAHDQQQSA